MLVTGGTVTTLTGYNVHSFIASASIQVTRLGRADVLAVGGGGAGGSAYGRSAGGGGGGGVLQQSVFFAKGSFNVVVGAGGVASLTGANSVTQGKDSGITGKLVALGGGAGASLFAYSKGTDQPPTVGGCGGGGDSDALLGGAS